jgi:alkanesulfonate monooxygenase SsuD/methylene tetrahydromethanopterin reductase-like flavin-dependent oxidoreductase (luciferase family)
VERQPFYRSDDGLLRFGFIYPNAEGGPGTLSAKAHGSLTDLASRRHLAAVVERAGFDYLFLADEWDDRIPGSAAHPEPVTLLFALALAGLLVPLTERIGIVSTVHTAFFIRPDRGGQQGLLALV